MRLPTRKTSRGSLVLRCPCRTHGSSFSSALSPQNLLMETTHLTPFCLLLIYPHSKPSGSAQLRYEEGTSFRSCREGKGAVRERSSQTRPDLSQNCLQETDKLQLPNISSAALEDISHYLLTRTTFLKCPTLFRLISYSLALNCFNLSKNEFRWSSC